MKHAKPVIIIFLVVVFTFALVGVSACQPEAATQPGTDTSHSTAGYVSILPSTEATAGTSSAAETTTTAASTAITQMTTNSSTTTTRQTTSTRQTSTTTRTASSTTRTTATTTTTTTKATTTTTTTKKATIAWGSASQIKSDCIAIAQGVGYTYDSSLNSSNSHYIDPLYTGAYSSASAVKASVLDFMQTYQSVGYTFCNFGLESYGDGEYKIWIFVG